MSRHFYLVERTDKWGYDEYDSFVVSAKDEEEALSLAYNEAERIMWGGRFTKDNTKIELLQATESKIILGSFNAG